VLRKSGIKIKKLHPDATIPVYKTKGSAGADLSSVEDVVIKPGQYALVKTGLAVELPEGWEMQIRPRSGLAFKHGVTVLNAPGTIDSDYRGEIGVLLINHGRKRFRVEVGDRIAQAVLAGPLYTTYKEEDDLTTSTRGDGGFGSTGRH